MSSSSSSSSSAAADEAVTGRVLLPSSVTPSHYYIELSPDLDALTFLGSQEVRLVVSGVTKEITMHAKEIIIDTATYGEKAAAMTSISYNLKYNTVTIGFDEELPIGEGVLKMKFKGILNSDMNGFYKSTYTDAKGQKKTVASTQFESLDARRAFPCWDEPAQKCTFDISLVIKRNLCAVSNMPEVKVTSIANTDLVKIDFDTSPKMSTYLVAFCVGEFDWVSARSKGGVFVRVLTPPGRSAEGKFSLDVAVKCLDFYDDFFQIKYPLPKLDMICITEFAMGAMENWGLVTYRETAIMVDEAKASVQNKQRVAIVVAHELAHQWFGNLVTMKWWDGLWLNEGFAAFMEHFAVDAILPEYKIWEQFTVDAFSHAQRLDAMRSSHPIIVPIRHAEEVEQVFDAISYCKGSCVVNMVYCTLGFDKFREGLRIYMNRHKYGNTETRDLWNCWTEATGGQVQVHELMDAWTTQIGYPMVRVESEQWSKEEVTFTLNQERFLSDGSFNAATDVDTVWSIPLLFTTSSTTSSTAVLMTNKTQSFTVKLSSDSDYVKINAGQKALIRVSHSKKMLHRLVTHGVPTGSLSDVDVASLLLDAYALCKANQMSVEDLVLVMKSVSPSTRSLVIWNAISASFTAMNLFLEDVGGEPLRKFQEFGKVFVASALKQIGWDASSTDNHTDKLVRALVIGMLDAFAWNDEETLRECRRRFDGHFSEPALLPNEFKTTVFKIVLMNGDVKEYDRILGIFKGTEDNSEIMKVYGSLGAASSRDLKVRTLNWAYFDPAVKLQDFFYCIGPVASSKEGGLIAWNFFKDNFEAVKAKLKKSKLITHGCSDCYVLLKVHLR